MYLVLLPLNVILQLDNARAKRELEDAHVTVAHLVSSDFPCATVRMRSFFTISSKLTLNLSAIEGAICSLVNENAVRMCVEL